MTALKNSSMMMFAMRMRFGMCMMCHAQKSSLSAS